MAITDINISDTLETSAPSIKYEGDEGPKSPEEQRIAQLKKEYMQYVFERKELEEPIMSFEEWYQAVYQASKMGVDASQQPQPQPQLQPQPQMRQPVAYGGIMDLGGRRRYGWGSKIKKRLRKLIPNEAAQIASMAAPFVAPFNPIAGGLMAGVGGFDRTGSIGKSLKSGLMTYGGGQLARGIGGGMGNVQKGFNPMGGMGAAGTSAWSSPISSQGGLGKMWDQRGSNVVDKVTDKISVLDEPTLAGDFTKGGTKIIEKGIKQGTSGIMNFINNNATAILLGSMGLAYATTKPEDVQDAMKMSRGTGMDIDSIREEVRVAFEGGEDAWNELKKKYPYIGQFSTKKAEGGRIGLYAGGQSTPSDYTMEDARKTSMQDKMGGITDVMKQADLYRQGDVGQFYAADGGRTRYAVGSGRPPVTMGQPIQAPQMPAQPPQRPNPMPVVGNPMMGGMNPMMNRPMMGGMNPMARGMNPMMGGRRMAQEGGLMDLGGMEKDYRQEGGFVPLGGKEKADDVPARLSKNEFVFTADAVRGAGGGDIDRGAEVMENIMKNLEQGGQISEETQGLSGAREMFNVSERLSEVV